MRSFFLDRVKVRTTDVTKDAGVAGLLGEVSGFTTPSLTELTVIGILKDDFAVGVLLDGHDDTLWFAPELLEFVDHNAGTVIQVGKIVIEKAEQGEWKQVRSPRNPLGWFGRIFHIFRKRG